MKVLLYPLTLIASWFNTLPKLCAALLGCAWAYVSPTVPFALICIYAVLLDCLTAWRLNRRIHKVYPDAGADGKLKSKHLSDLFPKLAVVYLCIIAMHLVDNILLDYMGGLHLAQTAAAIFCGVTLVSCLENESSCNGATWARVLQKVVANKVSRHIDMTEDEFNTIINDQQSK